jgi:hypothetical protein
MANLDTVQKSDIRTWYDVDGWFRWIDFCVFEAVLGAQQDSAPGALVELGCYLGKSAVVIGDHWRADEDFVVVDLFGDTDALGDHSHQRANRREAEKSYKTLTRERFESNYLALHDRLPTVVQGPSSQIVEHLPGGSVRFLHIDASHLYPHVIVDARNAAGLMRAGGVVVFDDFRAEHTPGVSAAVWEAVATLGLIPVALTGTKFYGCFSEPAEARAAVRRLLNGNERLWSEVQEIAGHPVHRITRVDEPKPTTQQITEKLLTSTVDKAARQAADRAARLVADGTAQKAADLAAQRTADRAAEHTADLVLKRLDDRARRRPLPRAARAAVRRVRRRLNRH